MQEHPGALHVAEELQAEPGALVRPLDDAGDVRGHERLIVGSPPPRARGERRERVVGHLRARGGQARQERRLAGVRQAEEAHVGDEPQVESQPPLLARLAGLAVARGAVAVREEGAVAAAAAAAASHHETVPVVQHLADQLAGRLVARGGPGRNGDVPVGGVAARAVAGPAVPSAVGAVLRPGSAGEGGCSGGRRPRARRHRPCPRRRRPGRPGGRGPRGGSSRTRCRRRRP